MSYMYKGKRRDTDEWIEGWLVIESLLYGTKVSIRVPSQDHEDTDHDYEVWWPSVSSIDENEEVKKWKEIAKELYETLSKFHVNGNAENWNSRDIAVKMYEEANK